MGTAENAKSMFDAVWRNHGRRRVTIKLTTGTRTIPAGPKEGATPDEFEDVRVVRGRTNGDRFTAGGGEGEAQTRAYQVLLQELPEELAENIGGDLCIIDTDQSDSDPGGENETDPVRRQVQHVSDGFDGEIVTLNCGDIGR